MTRDFIINEFIADIAKYKQLARNIAGAQDADDLYQSCVLSILEFSEERLISYYNPTQRLKPFFIRMLLNQYKSKTSAYHKDYRKQEQFLHEQKEDIILNAPISSEEIEPEYFEKINEACENIYDNAVSPEVANLLKIVWKLYVKKKSLRKTLADLPGEYGEIVSLKDVHVIVLKFKRAIKSWLGLSMEEHNMPAFLRVAENDSFKAF